MKINSFNDLYAKYPIDRDEMTVEQEREFVQHCFDLYEKEGFAKVFWSINSDIAKHLNKPFTVVGRVTEKDSDLCCLPVWNIKFKDGKTLFAYPEEIIPSEMISSGCKLQNL